jgi:hypothetical protein
MRSTLLLLVAGKSKANAIRRKMSGEAVFASRSFRAEYKGTSRQKKFWAAAQNFSD